MDIEQLNEDLIKACRDGSLHGVKEALKNGVYIHYGDGMALREACAKGHLDVVRYLLTSPELTDHADIHANGDVALRRACEYGHLDVVKYLLTSPELTEHADVNVYDWPLQWACIHGHFDVVKYLLTSPELTEHADVNADNDGALRIAYDGLLRTAYGRSHLDVIQCLIQHGANLESVKPIESWFDDHGNDFMFETIENMTPEALQSFMQEHGNYIAEQYLLEGRYMPENLSQHMPDIEHQEQEIYL